MIITYIKNEGIIYNENTAKLYNTKKQKSKKHIKTQNYFQCTLDIFGNLNYTFGK